MKYFTKVLWSDKTKINLFSSDGKRWVWRNEGEALNENTTIKTIKHSQSINFWGCIGYNGTGNLYEIKGLMDGPMYVRILQENLFESAENLGVLDTFIFQQDNDPKHCSRIAKNFFEENQINLMEWPSQSPDLNVIEHVWAYVEEKYNQDPATNKNDAISKIFHIWENIPQSYIRNLINSIYRRCEAVIKMKGGATKY